MKQTVTVFLLGILVGAGGFWALAKPRPGPAPAELQASRAALDSAGKAADAARRLAALAQDAVWQEHRRNDSLLRIVARVRPSGDSGALIASAHAGAPPAFVALPAPVTAQLRADSGLIASLRLERDLAQVAVARLSTALAASDSVGTAAAGLRRLETEAWDAERAKLHRQRAGLIVVAVVAVAYGLTR